jgi:hypothetical protein
VGGTGDAALDAWDAPPRRWLVAPLRELGAEGLVLVVLGIVLAWALLGFLAG